jgi:hypothetical protein
MGTITGLLLILPGCGPEAPALETCEDWYNETFHLDEVDYYTCSTSRLDCESSGLELTAQLRDADGEHRTTFSASETTTVVAVLENLSSEPVTYDPVGCTVHYVKINGEDQSVGISIDCIDSPALVLEPGETRELGVHTFTAEDYGLGTVRAQLAFSTSEATCCPCTQWSVEE